MVDLPAMYACTCVCLSVCITIMDTCSILSISHGVSKCWLIKRKMSHLRFDNSLYFTSSGIKTVARKTGNSSKKCIIMENFIQKPTDIDFMKKTKIHFHQCYNTSSKTFLDSMPTLVFERTCNSLKFIKTQNLTLYLNFICAYILEILHLINFTYYSHSILEI